MKFFDTLLGFAVLTGPLWLILILLPVSIWIAVKVAKRFKQRSAKIAGGVGIFLLVFFVPFGDEIAGRIYLSHLCATEAGVKVYQTIELPGEYWEVDGEPKFYNEKNGNFDLTQIGTDFKTEEYPSMFPIEKFRFWYLEKQNGGILGEIISFNYMGGWISRNFTLAPGSGATCKQPILQSTREIMYSIFRPAKPSRDR
ncbi:MAG: hypothetical protein Q7J84_02155 [Sulfuricaulis sp.]|nr:hypothetical protein [Sulfuricaulis sp.]